jgi:hypothetical protein
MYEDEAHLLYKLNFTGVLWHKKAFKYLQIIEAKSIPFGKEIQGKMLGLPASKI